MSKELNKIYDLCSTEGIWIAVNQGLIYLSEGKITGSNLLDFLQDNLHEDKEVLASNLVIAQAKSLIDSCEKENEEFSRRIVELKEMYEIIANALVLAVKVLNRKDGYCSIEENEKITYAINLLNPKD